MFVNYLVGIFVFVFGVCIGSFLNCVIYRLEEEKSLAGRSFCPHCKHNLIWLDLMPVFSFLFLGGKCRYCGAKISAQYPLVEILTGLIFLLFFSVSLRALPQQGAAIQGFCTQTLDCFVASLLAMTVMFYVASALIVIFVYDLKHYIIPDKVLFPAVLMALVYDFFISGFRFQDSGFINYLLAALIASGFFFIIWLVSRGRAMGFGDVKLAVLMGLLLGLPNILVALFLAFFFGAIIGITLMFFRKKELKSEIPFGPFLITGTFLALLWGDQIINWYFKFFQI